MAVVDVVRSLTNDACCNYSTGMHSLIVFYVITLFAEHQGETPIVIVMVIVLQLKVPIIAMGFCFLPGLGGACDLFLQ